MSCGVGAGSEGGGGIEDPGVDSAGGTGADCGGGAGVSARLNCSLENGLSKLTKLSVNATKGASSSPDITANGA